MLFYFIRGHWGSDSALGWGKEGNQQCTPSATFQLLPQLPSNQSVMMYAIFYALKTTDETHSLTKPYSYVS